MGFRKSILDLFINYFAERKFVSYILSSICLPEFLKFAGLKLRIVTFDERVVDMVRGDELID